jgi:hypothetical protein
MLNAVKKMNAHQNKIPIVEFDEMKFEPAALKSKTSLESATRRFERHPAGISKHEGFARKWEILRAGSEGVSSFGPLVQSFRPRPPRPLRNSATHPVCESEPQAKK